MSFYQNRLQIETLFQQEFTIVHECVGVFGDNMVIDPPSTPWVRLIIQNSTTEWTGLASDCSRITGIVAVQVYTPLEIGPGEADRIADDISGIFRGARLSGIHFNPTNAVRIGEQDKYFRVDAITGFEADQIY